MDKNINVLDRKGDMVIVLKNPDQPIPDWPSPKKSQNDEAKDTTPSNKGEVKYLLSSKKLMAVSSYFEAALSGPWKCDVIDDLRLWELEGWDRYAFLLVVQILHGQTKGIPKCLDLEVVAHVALVVDYYQCHKPVYDFASKWMPDLSPQNSPPAVNRDTILGLFITYVFGHRRNFDMHINHILMVATGPIETLGLPIPQALVDTVEDERRDIITEISDAFKKIHKNLMDGKLGCCQECRHSLIQALFERADMVILNEEPWEHLTVHKAISMAHGIKAPYTTHYQGWKGPYLKGRDGHRHPKKYDVRCDMGQIGMYPMVTHVPQNPILKLDNFRRFDEKVDE